MTLFAPLFLIGLLGIALPLWLHRMNYSNPETRPFTATFLLQHAELTAATEHRLRYLLLLAARILALLFLVLLFTQPAWRDTNAVAAGSENRSLYLVVDTSLSMSAGDRFAQALDLAREEIADLQPGQQVQLFSMGERFAALSALTENPGEIRPLLTQLEPGTGSMDYGSAMQQLDNLLRSAPGSREVVLISDLQQSNMPDRFAELVPAAAGSMRIHSLDQAEPNWRLQARWDDGQIAVSLSGAPLDRELPLSIEINGESLGQYSLTADTPELRVGLGDTQLLPGGNSIAIELEADDALREDNTFYLAVDRSVRRRVLVLANEPDLNDAIFTETALQAISGQGIDVRTHYAGNPSAFILDDFDLVISNDLGGLPAGLDNDLQAYVENGGKLIGSLGPRTLNRNQVPVSGHSIGGDTQVNGGNARQYLVTAQVAHPLLTEVNLSGGIDVYRWTSVEPMASDTLLIRLANGAPWALEHPQGDGRVLLFTTPLDSSWSNLPLSPNFVPLLSNAVSWLTREFAVPTDLQTGSTLLAGRSTDAQISVPVQQILAPGGRAMLGLGQLDQVNLVTLEAAGVYQLQAAGSTAFVAVNTPVAESDLETLPVEQVERWLELTNGPAGESTAATGAPTTTEERWQSFEKWLLPLILIMILVESILANAHLWVRRQVAQ